MVAADCEGTFSRLAIFRKPNTAVKNRLRKPSLVIQLIRGLLLASSSWLDGTYIIIDRSINSKDSPYNVHTSYLTIISGFLQGSSIW